MRSWSALLLSSGAFLIKHSTKSLASQEISPEKLISCLSTYLTTILYTQDLLHRLFAADVVEGHLPRQQLIGQDAQAPQVDAPVVLLPLEDFGSHVVEGPAVRTTAACAPGCPPEIAQFGFALSGCGKYVG